MSNDTSNRAISDIYFAAFLRVLGVKLETHEKRGNRTLFIFEDSSRLEELRMAYYNKSEDVKVIPLDFANSVKDLKSLCYMS